MSKSLLVMFHALSPVHAGTGQGVGVIDLPIARERVTEFPIVPGSSLKGVLRSTCADESLKKALFGPDTNGASEHAGSVQLGDLQLLFFPVRSLKGVFAYVTCPLVLERFQRDLKNMGKPGWAVPGLKSLEHCVVAEKDMLVQDSKVYLEELDLGVQGDSADLVNWAKYIADKSGINEASFVKRVCLVHDDVFAFLTKTATEVRARIRLQEDTKTVSSGALWYEESLPAESILWSVGVVDPVPVVRGLRADWDEKGLAKQLQQLTQSPIQLGGKATVGKGFGRLSVVEV